MSGRYVTIDENAKCKMKNEKCKKQKAIRKDNGENAS